jgi:hypothetical protein
MPAEPKVVSNGPPRELAEVRAGSGFAWSCRGSRVENGQLTEICQITSGDRDEYDRHMRGHDLKPPKSTYQRWKPWTRPRPVTEYKPKPMDPGQRVQWTRVIEGHWEGRTYIEATDTSPPRFEGGTWVEETRETRTGVIWSVADTASAWWIQPDDDPARPVYVRRAGKRERYEHDEGALYEAPGVAEAARASLLRAEAIRKRGIFPVIDSQSASYGTRYSPRTSHIFLAWHSDPQCPRAAGKDRYDPDDGPQGTVYGYQPEGRAVRSLGQARWTALDVAQTLISGEQAPSCLCPDCIVNLDISRPAEPAAATMSEPADAPGTTAELDMAAGPGIAAEVAVPRAPYGSRAARTRLTVSLPPPATDTDFLDSCSRLGDVLACLVDQLATWTDSLDALNLPACVLTPLHQADDGLVAARSAASRAAAAFEDEFGLARQVAARGLRFTGTGHD